PLLRWATRADTEEYCRDRDVAYRHDSMNDDPRFTRVRVRKELIPMLAEFNPKIVETLARTAAMFADLQPEPEILQPETFSVKEAKGRAPDELRQMLREWLSHRRGSLRGITLKHIEAIERLIASEKSGRIVEIPGRSRIVKSGGRLTFKNIKVEK
ncbi:MAG: TilS substrate-binding domain-containing protein, partial [Acidobacteria bacterium]|nr:TilS substrate-binding domain-containing protein [Acidobacteriota bacterium]